MFLRGDIIFLFLNLTNENENVDFSNQLLVSVSNYKLFVEACSFLLQYAP